MDVSTTNSTSSRKRPNRMLRVKKYDDGTAVNGNGSGSVSIDMTGEIREGSVPFAAAASNTSSSSIPYRRPPQHPASQSLLQIVPPQTQPPLPPPLQRQRINLTSSSSSSSPSHNNHGPSLISLSPSASTQGSSMNAPPSVAVLSESSDDDDEEFFYDAYQDHGEEFVLPAAGSFPSMSNVLRVEKQQQEQQQEDEEQRVQLQERESQQLSKPIEASGNERMADDKEDAGVTFAGKQKEQVEAETGREVQVGGMKMSPGVETEAEAVNTTSSSDEAWREILQDQSDISTSQGSSTVSTTIALSSIDRSPQSPDKVVHQNSALSLPVSTTPPSFYHNSGVDDEDTTMVKEATSRYVAYRASLGQPLYSSQPDEVQPSFWSSSSTSVSDGGRQSSSAESSDRDTIMLNASPHSKQSQQSATALGTAQSAGRIDVSFQDGSLDSTASPQQALERALEYEDLEQFDDSLDDQKVVDTNEDDNGGDHSSAAVHTLALSLTHSSSPTQEVQDDHGNKDNSIGTPDVESTSETEHDDEMEAVEYVPDERYEKADRKRDEEERKQAARGLAAAAILQRGVLASTPMAVLDSESDHSAASSQQNIVSPFDLDDMHDEVAKDEPPVLTEREKRYQLYSKYGIYFRSSEDLSDHQIGDHSNSTLSIMASPVLKKSRSSIYEENKSGSFRKWLGAMLQWRHRPSKEQTDSNVPDATRSSEGTQLRAVEVSHDNQNIELSGVDDAKNNMLSSSTHERRKRKEEDEQKKKVAKMIAAAAVFRKDGLSHVEQIPKEEEQELPGNNDSIAAAAAAMAQRRKERIASVPSDDYNKLHEKSFTQPDGNESDHSLQVNEGSLAAQAAAMSIARKNSHERLKTVEDYDNLYKKPPAEKKEPQLMVKLRSVRRDPKLQDSGSVQDVDSQKHMFDLNPVSRESPNPYCSPSTPTDGRHGGVDTSLVAKMPFSGDKGASQMIAGRETSTGDFYGTQDLEAQVNSDSSASSLFDADPPGTKGRLGLGGGFWGHLVRGSVILILLATIALPVYFLVFADSDSSSNVGGSTDSPGGIFPPITSTSSPLVSVSPTATPSTDLTSAPTQRPVATSQPIPSASPTNQPSSVPTGSNTDSPSLASTTGELTVIPISAAPVPVIDPEPALQELLVSKWPELIASFESSGGTTTPAMQALQWLAADSNLNVYTDSKKIQRFTMALFYYSAGGDGWLHASEWLTPLDECTWYTSSSFRNPCDTDGNLFNLELKDEGLSGTLPAELALLSDSLTRLVLATDDSSGPLLGGTLPREIGLLTLLEYLSMSNQNLSRTLPSEIGQLSLLAVLDLENNAFGGPLPTSIGQLQRLNNLYLGFNQLSGAIPPRIGGLQLLVNLDLSGNQFSSTIPDELANLGITQNLLLGSNRLSGSIPLSLFDRLTNLQGRIDLSGNLLTGTIPTQVGMLSTIRTKLDLSSNQLSGPIPLEVGRLINLRSLHFQKNALVGSIPLSLSNMIQLEALRLEYNDLDGLVPPFVCNTLVTDRVASDLEPALFVTDCITEVDCPCCQYCCEESVGCEEM